MVIGESLYAGCPLLYVYERKITDLIEGKRGNVMQRYFINEPAVDNIFTIQHEDARHIVKVMRMQAGDEIICVDDQNRSALCKIAKITDETVHAEVVQWMEGSAELPIDVTIASGLPKGDKLELIIQKGTELGAFQFIPFTAARSIVKWDEKKAAKKLERWNKISKEAAEQSHRTRVPFVAEPCSLQKLIKHSEAFTHKVIAFEEAAKQGESSQLNLTLMSMQKGDSLLFVFGPEGGLSEQEVSILHDNGFISCGLGPRILRTETAPLYALSAVSYHFELMG